jgi:hypothetical protein
VKPKRPRKPRAPKAAKGKEAREAVPATLEEANLTAAEASAYDDGDLPDLGTFSAPLDDAGRHHGPGLDRH